MRANGLLLLTAALTGVGCSTSDGERVACEPLGSVDSPIALREVLGVGKTATGTLYVVDEDAEHADYRVFVSEGLALVRREVEGTGEESLAGARRLAVTARRGDEAFTLFIEWNGRPTRMVLEDGPLRDKNLDPSAHLGQELEIVDASVLQGLRVRNLPGDVVVEYSARVDETQRLVVTRPEHDWSYEDFRLFLGPPERIEERRVTSVERARDGGSTWIEFEVDGEGAEAFFPANWTPPNQPPAEDEPDTLKIGSKSHAIERFPRDAPALDDVAFVCLP
jgi:hypothetical protein